MAALLLVGPDVFDDDNMGSVEGASTSPRATGAADTATFFATVGPTTGEVPDTAATAAVNGATGATDGRAPNTNVDAVVVGTAIGDTGRTESVPSKLGPAAATGRTVGVAPAAAAGEAAFVGRTGCPVVDDTFTLLSRADIVTVSAAAATNSTTAAAGTGVVLAAVVATVVVTLSAGVVLPIATTSPSGAFFRELPSSVIRCESFSLSETEFSEAVVDSTISWGQGPAAATSPWTPPPPPAAVEDAETGAGVAGGVSTEECDTSVVTPWDEEGPNVKLAIGEVVGVARVPGWRVEDTDADVQI